MKRSNRLVLLVGVFLAIVAFVGILLLVRNPNGEGGPVKAPTTGSVVVAATDIPLSSRITADQLSVITLDLTAISPGAFSDKSQVVGQIARQPIANGAQITTTTLNGGQSGTVINVQVPVGQRAIAVRVDQISGVGTVIKNGDFVDAVIGLTEEQFLSIKGIETAEEATITAPGPKGASTKVLLQGMQVLGTLLPPVAPPAEAAPAASGAPTPPPGTTTLNEQQEIVILSVTAQQAEVIRYAQLQANPLLTLSLILRSPDDFIDPVTHQPASPAPAAAETTGVTLKILLDQYGVLPPVIEGPVLPNNRLPTPVRPTN